MAELRTQVEEEPLARRILAAFTERAGRIGLRALVMDDLARDLGVSKKTLYQQYAGKEDMVQALVERWVADMREAEQQRIAPRLQAGGVRSGIRTWASHWAENRGKFAPVFWRDLERDYPTQFALSQTVFEESRARAQAVIREHLRGGVPPAVATELFDLVVRHMTDPGVCDRLGLTRRATLLAALDIWANGALRADAP